MKWFSFVIYFQLASKTAELSKACEKQFKLEQELAFYKLDAKFEHLGTLPPPDGLEVDKPSKNNNKSTTKTKQVDFNELKYQGGQYRPPQRQPKLCLNCRSVNFLCHLCSEKLF